MARSATMGSSAREPFQLDVEDLAPGSLRVLAFDGREAMNETFSFDVLVTATQDRAVEGTLTRPATLIIEAANAQPQLVHGVIGAIASEGVRERSIPLYRVRLVPRL